MDSDQTVQTLDGVRINARLCEVVELYPQCATQVGLIRAGWGRAHHPGYYCKYLDIRSNSSDCDSSCFKCISKRSKSIRSKCFLPQLNLSVDLAQVLLDVARNSCFFFRPWSFLDYSICKFKKDRTFFSIFRNCSSSMLIIF